MDLLWLNLFGRRWLNWSLKKKCWIISRGPEGDPVVPLQSRGKFWRHTFFFDIPSDPLLSFSLHISSWLLACTLSKTHQKTVLGYTFRVCAQQSTFCHREKKNCPLSTTSGSVWGKVKSVFHLCTVSLRKKRRWLASWKHQKHSVLFLFLKDFRQTSQECCIYIYTHLCVYSSFMKQHTSWHSLFIKIQ